ncbi:hypothetical protein ALQ20_200188 [Pseudomonas syringae pv. atrofaciens]|nr:hypothetical protein ALQ20_200188 [Pseudomonas syringae pv. atrofaciens]
MSKSAMSRSMSVLLIHISFLAGPRFLASLMYSTFNAFAGDLICFARYRG